MNILYSNDLKLPISLIGMTIEFLFAWLTIHYPAVLHKMAFGI